MYTRPFVPLRCSHVVGVTTLSLLPYLLLLVARPAARRSRWLQLTLPLTAAYLWVPVSQI
jgi:hypothetical protein